MYRHCIYCSANLRANEAVEAFPVGRMLAFDGAKGRLWAVCPKCARWNLAPIEERWEAVEEAEKRFADARLRVQRENIGMAKLRDGTRLVRVGSALPGELAGWRYGESFRRRQRRSRLMRRAGLTASLAQVGMVGAAWAGLVPGAALLLPLVVFPLSTLGSFLDLVPGHRRLHPLPREAAPDLPPMVLRRRDLNGARVWLADDGGFRLGLPEVFVPGGRDDETVSVQVEGESATRLLAKAMVIRNAGGGNERQVESAHALLFEAGSPEAVLMGALKPSGKRSLDLGIRLQHLRQPAFGTSPNFVATGDLHTLALEMALHEESERRALEGELALLQSAWREAEEIASIADKLATESGLLR